METEVEGVEFVSQLGLFKILKGNRSLSELFKIVLSLLANEVSSIASFDHVAQ